MAGTQFTRVKVIGVLIYTAVWFILLQIGKPFLGQATFSNRQFFLAIVSGYALLILYYLVAERHLPKLWSMIWLMFLGSLALQILEIIRVTGYGDRNQFARLMMTDSLQPRWLVGYGMLSSLMHMLSNIPFVGIDLTSAKDVNLLVKVVGGIVMIVCSIYIFNKWPDRLSVILTGASPIYVMFSIGYDEYYPYIAGLFLIFLLSMADKEPKDQNIYWLGFLLGILPAFYLPFLPISVLGLVYFFIFDHARGFKLLLIAISIYLILVQLFWQAGLINYFTGLSQHLNIGDANTQFMRYQGQSAGQDSIFFKWQYALSREHLGDLLYMFFWSGNSVTALMFAYCIFHLSRKKMWGKVFSFRAIWFIIAMLGWGIFYFVFMLPKLGPQKDIDLFFSVYLTLAFATGYLLDGIKKHQELPVSKIDYLVVPALIANALVFLFFLLSTRIPGIV